MNFKDCIDSYPFILMEGALGERLKREFDLDISGTVAMADLIYQQKGRMALKTLWNEYIDIAYRYQLPFLATTAILFLEYFPKKILMKNCAWKESRNLCIIGKEYKEEKTMDILKNENIKNAAAVLWHKFLLAETVNDIILSEIKDRLYLQYQKHLAPLSHHHKFS